jgi:hypothetical protein
MVAQQFCIERVTDALRDILNDSNPVAAAASAAIGAEFRLSPVVARR